MTIEIIEIKIEYNDDGTERSQYASFAINNGGPAYLWGAGSLSLELDEAGIQTSLEANEAALFAAAESRGALLSTGLQSRLDLRKLPNWSTWTGQEAADALQAAILSGMTKTEARAAIDAQFAGVTNLATLAAATIAILKQLSDAVIDGRDVGHQNEARAIMYLRDIVVEK